MTLMQGPERRHVLLGNGRPETSAPCGSSSTDWDVPPTNVDVAEIHGAIGKPLLPREAEDIEAILGMRWTDPFDPIRGPW